MRKMMIVLTLAGVGMGVVGGILGQFSGAMGQIAIEGELSEGPLSFGLVVRIIFEVLGPSLGSTIGIYIAGVKGGKTGSSRRFGITALGSTLGSFVGWIVSYPLSPIFWILIPSLFATAVGLVAFNLKQ